MEDDPPLPACAIRSGMQSKDRAEHPLRPTGNSPSHRHLTPLLLLFFVMFGRCCHRSTLLLYPNRGGVSRGRGKIFDFVARYLAKNAFETLTLP